MVIDAEASAGVDALEVNAFAIELLDEFSHSLHGLTEGLCGANLRADVHADAVRNEPAVSCRALVDCQRAANVDAEFVFAQAGRDVWMRVGENIRIDAQCETRGALDLASSCSEQFQFSFALHVEFENVGLECAIDFGSRFSNS